jgi:hypothetical protein
VAVVFFRRATVLFESRWNQCGELLVGAGGVALHAAQDVLRGLDRDGDVGVAEPLADDLYGHAFFDQQAAVGVAEVVEADAWHAGSAGGSTITGARDGFGPL